MFYGIVSFLWQFRTIFWRPYIIQPTSFVSRWLLTVLAGLWWRRSYTTLSFKIEGWFFSMLLSLQSCGTSSLKEIWGSLVMWIALERRFGHWLGSMHLSTYWLLRIFVITLDLFFPIEACFFSLCSLVAFCSFLCFSLLLLGYLLYIYIVTHVLFPFFSIRVGFFMKEKKKDWSVAIRLLNSSDPLQEKIQALVLNLESTNSLTIYLFIIHFSYSSWENYLTYLNQLKFLPRIIVIYFQTNKTFKIWPNITSRQPKLK